jgi:hypothetical protein
LCVVVSVFFSGTAGVCFASEVSFCCVVKENVTLSLRIAIKLLYFDMQLMYLYVT